MLTVCLISQEYPPETGWGGIGTYVKALAHGLALRGHAVHVLSRSLDDRDHYSLDGAVHLHRITEQQFPIPSYLRRRSQVKDTIERAYRVDRYLRRLHRQVRFDVIEAPNWGAEALLACLHPVAPIVVRICTPLDVSASIAGNQDRTRLGFRLRQFMEALPAKRSARLIANSRYSGDLALRLYGTSPDRLRIVYLGLYGSGDVRQDSVAFEPRSGSSSSRGTVVLYVGRLEPRKGTQYFLEAIPRVVAQIPSVRFIVVGRESGGAPGGGTFRDYFASFAPDQAKLATTFLGHVDDAELRRLYATCDIFVAPSLFESFGLIHLEAMAYGKPVVACRATATPEIVLDGVTGLLVAPKDSPALATAMVTLLSEPDLALEMGKRARERVREFFSVERMIEGTLAVYRELIPE